MELFLSEQSPLYNYHLGDINQRYPLDIQHVLRAAMPVSMSTHPQDLTLHISLIGAGDIMALKTTHRERIFPSDKNVPLQKKIPWKSSKTISQMSPRASFHVKLGKRAKFQILNILNSCFLTVLFSFIWELLYGHYQSGRQTWGERKEILIIFPRNFIL